MRLVLVALVMTAAVGCYSSHPSDGCVYEGRYYADGETFGHRDRSYYLTCHHGSVTETIADFWEPATDAGTR
jgi:hypothetical protein